MKNAKRELVSMHFRTSKSLRAAIRKKAKQNGVSMTDYIEAVMSKAVRRN